MEILELIIRSVGVHQLYSLANALCIVCKEIRHLLVLRAERLNVEGLRRSKHLIISLTRVEPDTSCGINALIPELFPWLFDTGDAYASLVFVEKFISAESYLESRAVFRSFTIETHTTRIFRSFVKYTEVGLYNLRNHRFVPYEPEWLKVQVKIQDRLDDSCESLRPVFSDELPLTYRSDWIYRPGSEIYIIEVTSAEYILSRITPLTRLSQALREVGYDAVQGCLDLIAKRLESFNRFEKHVREMLLNFEGAALLSALYEAKRLTQIGRGTDWYYSLEHIQYRANRLTGPIIWRVTENSSSLYNHEVYIYNVLSMLLEQIPKRVSCREIYQHPYTLKRLQSSIVRGSKKRARC